MAHENLGSKGQIRADSFGKDFKWGISSSAYQTEGAFLQEGKSKSIWDVFTHEKDKIRNGENADKACDFYHLYKDDINIISNLNIPNFRFSLSWPRIIPNGYGPVNPKGLDFYHRVIDYCLEKGIEPWITLYHWDLPQQLELHGGWTNRQIVNWFRNYVTVCAKAFGDKVKHWMVLNEPMVFTGAGHFMGIHAPGRKGMKNFLPAIHHAALCQAEGSRVIRNFVEKARIGSTFSTTLINPYRNIAKDQKAAKRVDALLNRLFLEPALGLGYPFEDLPYLHKIEKYMRSDDAKMLKADFDFIGIQNYTREIVKYSFFTPFINATVVKAENRNVPVTSLNWEIWPESLYEIIKKVSNYAGVKQIIVTENGAAFHDQLVDGKVHDEKRIAYLKDHISQVLKAKQEGYKVEGYFIWTLTDNFEWAEGFDPRFGLVYVDFETQQRFIKASGEWYRDWLANITTLNSGENKLINVII